MAGRTVVRAIQVGRFCLPPMPPKRSEAHRAIGFRFAAGLAARLLVCERSRSVIALKLPSDGEPLTGCPHRNIVRTSPPSKGCLPVTASWRSGERRPRRAPGRSSGDVCAGVRPHPPERTTVRTSRGASTRSAHRHYERSPQDGSRAGRRAGGESGGQGEVRERGANALVALTVPRTGSAEVGVRKTPRRAPETAPEKRNVSGAVPAPATPSHQAKDHRR
jgi:hypothetical protein